MSNKKIITSSNTESKDWNFAKGNVQLNFKLRVDIKEEMKSFVELLKIAQASVEAELQKRFLKN